MFPFKALHECHRHTVGVESPESGVSHRAVLDALVENVPGRAVPNPPGDVADDDSLEYHAGSLGINRALGRDAAIYRGSHRHPDWSPETWKMLPPLERRLLSDEFFQGIQVRLEDAGAAGDRWVLVEGRLERMHSAAHTALFDPSSAPDIPVDIQLRLDTLSLIHI